MDPGARSRPQFDGLHPARKLTSINDAEWAIRRGGG
jgi:hypothetical protein